MKIISHLLVLAALFTTVPQLYAQIATQAWAVRYNGSGNGTDAANAIAIDSNGDVIIAGYSTGVNSFKDYYVAKYRAIDGSLLWDHRYNGSANGSDEAAALVIDTAGDVIVTGFLKEATTAENAYTTKFRGSDGVLLWERRYQAIAATSDYGTCLALASSGDVIVGGFSFSGEGYLARYRGTDGQVLWERLPPSSGGLGIGPSPPTALIIDPNGDVAVTGSTYRTATSDDYITEKGLA